MADISRGLVFRRLRGTPTNHVLLLRNGRPRRSGTGLTFLFRPAVAVLAEIPVDDRELPLLFRARTRDFQEVNVAASVTFRITEPETAAARIDFGIDPVTGAWRSTPLDQIAGLITELAKQPALDTLATVPLADAITTSVVPVRQQVTAALATDGRLAEMGVTIVAVRVAAIRPMSDLDRVLQTPVREQVQAEADRATYERRALAVERERTIAENELQNQIELARRREQLVAQDGANAQLAAEQQAAAEAIQLDAEVTRQRAVASARADATRVVGAAEAEAKRAELDAYAAVPTAVLQALALRELAGSLPEIGQLTVTPDLLTGVLTRLGAQ